MKILYLLAPLPLLVVLAQAQVYVSPQGQAGASGSNAAPVKSIHRAIEMAESGAKHEVVLLPGTYRLAEPLRLGAKDSGLVLRAATDGTVLLSGGVRIRGWKPVNGHGLWSAAMPADAPMPRQIYVDGVRADRTSGRLPVELTMTSTGYEAATDVLSHWRNPAALEMVYTGGNGVWGERTAGIGSWTEPRCPVAAIHGTSIVMAEPCWTNSTRRVMLPSGKRTANLVGPASVGKQPTSIENAYELLGRPGEFYADPVERRLYYVPRQGEDLRSADVEMPALETVLEIAGTEQTPVRDVTVKGVTFSYAGWQAPSSPEGFSEIQANFRVTGKDGATKQALCDFVLGGTCPFGAWTPEPGNVRVSFGDGVHFERDRFTHLGAAGLAFTDGAHNDSVKGCVFTDISGNGVELAGVDKPEAPDAEFAVHNRIEDNVFRDVGAEFRGGIPIVVGYARYTEIAHNEIDRVPYAAISIGWGGWPDKIGKPGVANRSAGNVIEKNRIHQFMLVLSDGGGIYTQGRTGKDLANGEVVQGNFVSDQVSSGHALYTDNGSAMITVRGNVVWDTNFDNWGSRHRDYYDGGTGENDDPLAIVGNWWQQGTPESDSKQVLVQGNQLIGSVDEAPPAVREQAGLEPEYRGLLHAAGPLHAPEPPSGVTAFLAGTKAYVSWREPVYDGGSPVMRYVVSDESGDSATVTEAEFTQLAYATLTLKAGGSHQFVVRAVNAAGESPKSIASREVTAPAAPLPVPGAMQHVAAYVQGGRASIHFGTPKENGEDLIGVVVAVDDAQHKRMFTGHRVVTLEGRHVTFVTVEGLTPGRHRFGVAAVNASGEGEMIWVQAQLLLIGSDDSGRTTGVSLQSQDDESVLLRSR